MEIKLDICSVGFTVAGYLFCEDCNLITKVIHSEKSGGICRKCKAPHSAEFSDACQQQVFEFLNAIIDLCYYEKSLDNFNRYLEEYGYDGEKLINLFPDLKH